MKPEIEKIKVVQNSEITENLAPFFELLAKIDKRVNPELYEKRNRSTDNPDQA